MHMRFTDEELLRLAEMLTLACWTTFWNHKPGADEGVAQYDDMLDKILNRLVHNGQGNQVEMDPDRQRLRLRKDKEEGSFYAQSFDEMRNEIFWEELVARMAEREVVKKQGPHYLETLSDAERKRILEPIGKRFWEEFSRNGIANLHVIARLMEG
jgi:hypothetical protein